MKRISNWIGWMTAWLGILSWISAAEPVGTAFSYQGRITADGIAVTAAYDFEFRLYDAGTGGTQVGSPLVLSPVNVMEGIFHVSLDFGAAVFGSEARWLEVRVRPQGSGAERTILGARSRFLAAPFALYALNGVAGPAGPKGDKGDPGSPGAPGAVGPVGPAGATGPAGPVGAKGDIGASGPAGAAGAVGPVGPKGDKGDPGATGPAGPTGAAGAVGPAGPKGDKGDSGVPGAMGPAGPVGATGPVGPAGSADAWALLGNSGTSEGVNFLGTIDAKRLELRTGNRVAFRLVPVPEGTPHVIGGSDANSNKNNTIAGFIGGGGDPQNPHTVGNYGVVGGGSGNHADLAYSAVLGGKSNFIEGKAEYGAIGGGHGNTVTENWGTIPGGKDNVAAGDYSLAAGQRAKANHTGAFVWSDSQAADFASTANDQFNVRANQGVRIAGGTTALHLVGNGAIRVESAGINTATPAFTHKATAATVSGSETRIDHPLCNGAPTAILIVTPVYNPAGQAGVRNDKAVVLWYNAGFWRIYNADASAMPVGAAFNILVIKP